ncbi:hypothetical protein GCM10011374_29680 [Kocuria dechangensis]|uniref:SLH domain-containing protein n=1 Tax=Kocuria dechangensis TaxID=1176249 RepID=A0A917H152_9MICC|nr:S-layer homology domain-containing protein [Kocuria dechangensis]GGG64178.1 hypothetical protein GCM10011374_29680 [Kocuria dechangensis]
MHQEASTTGVSRRALLSATALLGPAAAVLSTPVTSAPAAAAVVLGSKAATGSLGLTGTVVGRHRNLFRSFNLTSSTGVGVIKVGSVHYLVTTNTGDRADTIQIFDTATGALHYRASTPSNASGNFVHDGLGTLWFTSGGALMKLSVAQRTIAQIGTLPSGVSGLYDLVRDHRGRLWAGTYPAGVAVCLDPATGRELTRTPKLGTGNDYVRSLSVSSDGRTLWAGTGTADPDLFRIDVDAPSSPTRVGIPGRGLNSFVLRTATRGRKVFVWHDDAKGTEIVSVHDTQTGRWSATPCAMSGRSLSAVDAAGFSYANAKGTLMRFRPGDEVLTAEAVASVADKYTMHTGLVGDDVLLVSAGNSSLSSVRITKDGVVRPAVRHPVVLTTLDTQSMVIDRATSTVYAGGYRGDGLCATNLATGAFAHSAATAGIGQIEGMMVDEGTLYVGSYGSAVVVQHTTAPGVEDAASFRQLARLGESHLQSRIFAWAVADSHVVFGTVPEYGYRGGALGTIERSTGKVTVYNKIIPELSIVGLAASGHTVYGTTSVRSGYGIDDWSGDAVVFAADARTGAVLWKRALPGLDEAYGPVLLDGKLYVATLDTVVELRLSDGAPLSTFVLGSRTGRAAWNSVDLALIPGTKRLAHLAGGSLSVLEPATGRFSTVLTGANRHLDFDRDGAPWVTVGNDLVKLRLDSALGTASTYAAPSVSPFIDVATTQPFYREITWLAAAGISTGWVAANGTRTYRPLQAINRDAMAAFLYRAAGSPPFVPPKVSPFKDVPTTNPYYTEIAWLADRKISTGWPDGTYRPLQTIKRDAMAAFLYRAAGSPAYTPPRVSPFRDVRTSQPFYKEMAWLADRKISTGWPDGTYRPWLAINRDAMAAFIYRAAVMPR